MRPPMPSGQVMVGTGSVSGIGLASRRRRSGKPRTNATATSRPADGEGRRGDVGALRADAVDEEAGDRRARRGADQLPVPTQPNASAVSLNLTLARGHREQHRQRGRDADAGEDQRAAEPEDVRARRSSATRPTVTIARRRAIAHGPIGMWPNDRPPARLPTEKSASTMPGLESAVRRRSRRRPPRPRRTRR